jgi:hypothetical protein
MIRSWVGLCVLLMSASSLSATRNTAPSDPLPGADRNDCFTISLAKDRSVLDNKRLVVWANSRKPYLVELDRPVPYLDSGGQSIVLMDGDGDGQVCRSLRDSVVIQDALLPKHRVIVAVTSLGEEEIRTLEQKYQISLARKKRGQWNSRADTPGAIEPTAEPSSSTLEASPVI